MLQGQGVLGIMVPKLTSHTQRKGPTSALGILIPRLTSHTRGKGPTNAQGILIPGTNKSPTHKEKGQQVN